MKRFSVLFLIVGLTYQVQAGVPEPNGVWEFNAPDPNSATVGTSLEVVGTTYDIAGVDAYRSIPQLQHRRVRHH